MKKQKWEKSGNLFFRSLTSVCLVLALALTLVVPAMGMTEVTSGGAISLMSVDGDAVVEDAVMLADSSYTDMPDAVTTTVTLYQADGADGAPGTEISSGDAVLLANKTALWLGFTWSDLSSSSGLQTGVKYQLGNIENYLSFASTESAVYYGSTTKVATIGITNSIVWIEFESLAYSGVYAYYSCSLDASESNVNENGELDIKFGTDTIATIVVSDFLPNGPSLEKTGTLDLSNGVINWTVTYTAAEEGYENCKYIDEGDRITIPTTLVDTLPVGVTYVESSSSVFEYDETKQTLTISKNTLAGVAAGASETWTYQTSLSEDVKAGILAGTQESVSYTNEIAGYESTDGEKIEALTASDTVTVSSYEGNQQGIAKEGVYSYENGKRIVTWTVTVNTLGSNFNTLTLVDTMGSGLTLNEDGKIKVNGSELTAGLYTIEENTIKIPLYTNGSAVITPENGKYTITYTTIVSDDYFLQTKDGDGTTLKVSNENVSNSATLEWKWLSGLTGESPTPPTVEKDGTGIKGLSNTMLEKTAKSYDPATRILTWTVTLNPNEVNITGGTFKDVLANGGIVTDSAGNSYYLELNYASVDDLKTELGESVTKYIATNNAGDSTLEFVTSNNVETSSETTSSTRTIGFKFNVNEIKESISFTVQAKVISASFWATNQDSVEVENDASLTDVSVKGSGASATTTTGLTFSDSAKIPISSTVLQKTHTAYDALTNQMTWQLTVNSNKVSDLGAVVITDTLPAGMTYVTGSCAVTSTSGSGITFSDASSSGSETSSNTIKVETRKDSDGKEVVTWTISSDILKGTELVFTYQAEVETAMSSDDNKQSTPFISAKSIYFKNSASMTSDAYSTKSVTVTKDVYLNNTLLTKKQTSSSGNKVSYQITLNPYGAKLDADSDDKIELVDTMPAGLVIDLDSIELYKAEVTMSFSSASYSPTLKAAGTKLTEGTDYTVTYEAGTEENTVTFTVADATAYVLTYDAYVTQVNVSLTNKLELAGTSVTLEALSNQEAEYTLKAYGGAITIDLPASNWTLQITKIDTDKNPITFSDSTATHAPFGVYTDASCATLLLSATCDLTTGVCTFSQPKSVLDNVTELYLKEINAPDGYVISEASRNITELEELKDGETVTLSIANAKDDGSAKTDDTDDKSADDATNSDDATDNSSSGGSSGGSGGGGSSSGGSSTVVTDDSDTAEDSADDQTETDDAAEDDDTNDEDADEAEDEEVEEDEEEADSTDKKDSNSNSNKKGSSTGGSSKKDSSGSSSSTSGSGSKTNSSEESSTGGSSARSGATDDASAAASASGANQPAILQTGQDWYRIIVLLFAGALLLCGAALLTSLCRTSADKKE